MRRRPPRDPLFPYTTLFRSAEADEVLDLEGVLGELAHGEEGSADGKGMDHGVDAGAVREAGVDHGCGLVDAPADLGHDLVDDPPEVILVDEGGPDGLDLAGTLDVDVLGPVDHHLGDVVL